MESARRCVESRRPRVLLHRGMIDVESEPGKGATFIVTLPK